MSLREALELIIFMNALSHYVKLMAKAYNDAEIRKKIDELTKEMLQCTDMKCYDEINREINRLEKMINEKYGNVKPNGNLRFKEPDNEP